MKIMVKKTPTSIPSYARIRKVRSKIVPQDCLFSKDQAEILQTQINALNQTMDDEVMDQLFETNCNFALQCPVDKKEEDTEYE